MVLVTLIFLYFDFKKKKQLKMPSDARPDLPNLCKYAQDKAGLIIPNFQ